MAAQKDKNDPFETHKKGGFFGSIWGSKDPKKGRESEVVQIKKSPGGEKAGARKGYKADEKLPPPPSLTRLIVFPMALFLAQALSFTIFWELNKGVPIVIAVINLCLVFDQSSLGERKNRFGEEADSLLPALNGPDGVRAMRVWLRIVVAWLGVFLGGVTGMNADETHMSQFYVITFGRTYENVLANMPGAAYSDAGKIWFAESSSIASERAIGFKEKGVYCAAPVLDTNQGVQSVAFWAIGYDCCDARGDFKCGAGTSHHGGVRAPPDGVFAQDRAMFMKAVKQSAAVNSLTVDDDVILLHWVNEPDTVAKWQLLSAIGAVLIGWGLFALLALLVVGIGLFAEHEYTERQSHRSFAEDMS
jgi:hypothetical protein